MKRLVIMATCLAMLMFSGCANGLLGGMFGNPGCNTRPTLFQNGGLLSDGPVRQFLRGDQCDSCNAHAGQMQHSHVGATTCDACGAAVAADPYALPNAPLQTQPMTSFYQGDGNVILNEPSFPSSNMGSPLVPMTDSIPSFDTMNADVTEPPFGMN